MQVKKTDHQQRKVRISFLDRSYSLDDKELRIDISIQEKTKSLFSLPKITRASVMLSEKEIIDLRDQLNNILSK